VLKNTANQKFTVIAFNAAGRVSGAAAAITCTLAVDGSTRSATNDVNPVEIGTTGVYVFDLTADETNGHALSFVPACATAGVQVLGSPSNVIYTSESAVEGQYSVRINAFDSETNSAIAGASITIRDEDDVVVAFAITRTSGFKLFGLDAGSYVALVSAGATYDTVEIEMTVSSNDVYDAPLVANEVADPEVEPVVSVSSKRVYTAVDWEIPFKVGSLTGITYSSLVFTLKSSPTEQEDNQAEMQIKLSSPIHANDGLQLLNGSSNSISKDWASIEISDTATGTGVIKVKAIATSSIDSTNQDYWNISEQGLESQRAWRQGSALRPPLLHWDVKRLDGAGKASPVRAEGLLIVAEAVTQNVA
jgi:hypothetical protein